MKSPAQIAYERDLARHPAYHDGSPRPAWDRLGELARGTWERNPMDREENGS